MAPRLILASGSRHRRAVLIEAGYDPVVRVPGVEESDLQARLAELGAHGVAVGLARRKAAAVDDDGAVVLAADQVGVLDGPEGPTVLTKPATADAAVRQLMTMAGTTHRLVNGIVVAGPAGMVDVVVDEVEVEMADFEEPEARAYVTAHRPFDTAGGYRIEDDAGLVVSTRGSGIDAVMGLPMAVVAPLLAGRGIRPGPPVAGRGRIGTIG